MNLDIRKEPGSISRHKVARDDMILINRLSKAELTPDQVYTFAIRLCDNEVDRDWERFDEAGLEALSALFVGKSGIFDHHWSAQEQTARLYRTEVCRESGTTAAGDGIRYLKGYAYMLRSEKNRDLIEEIEAGIKKEVSVGCSVAGRVCSVCGADHCGHQGGSRYGGKLCYFTLTGPTDAYEWSFVAVPAQRRAGVIKAFAGAPAPGAGAAGGADGRGAGSEAAGQNGGETGRGGAAGPLRHLPAADGREVSPLPPVAAPAPACPGRGGRRVSGLTDAP